MKKPFLILFSLFITAFLIVNTANAQSAGGGISNPLWKLSSNKLAPVSSSWGLKISNITPAGCLQVDGSGNITSSGALDCNGSANGDTDWTFFNNSGIKVATSTNQVLIGASATTTTALLDVEGATYIKGILGIGTVSPTGVNANAKLTVAGIGSQDIIASSTDNTTSSDAILQAYAPGVRVFVGAHGANQISTRYGLTLGGYAEITAMNSSFGTTNGLIIGTNNATPLIFGTNNLEVGRFLSSGFFGIGTTTPSAFLSLQTGLSTGNAFVVATSSGNQIGGFDNSGHTFTSGPAPVISSCGTGSGTVVGDDQSGVITTATAAVACTATFAKAYAKTPICTVTDNSLVGFADVASISTTAVTFGISSALTGGNLYYNCSYHQ